MKNIIIGLFAILFIISIAFMGNFADLLISSNKTNKIKLNKSDDITVKDFGWKLGKEMSGSCSCGDYKFSYHTIVTKEDDLYVYKLVMENDGKQDFIVNWVVADTMLFGTFGDQKLGETLPHLIPMEPKEIITIVYKTKSPPVIVNSPLKFYQDFLWKNNPPVESHGATIRSNQQNKKHYWSAAKFGVPAQIPQEFINVSQPKK